MGEIVQEQIEKVLAGYFSHNNMPDMSGDMRRRLTPDMLRKVQGAARDVIEMAALALDAALEWAERYEQVVAERDRLREALEEIERLYYTEGKDASWRAAHMRAIATDAIERAALSKGEG